jgi:hypothetical protein
MSRNAIVAKIEMLERLISGQQQEINAAEQKIADAAELMLMLNAELLKMQTHLKFGKIVA